jgi:pimeloyl-ACP methyl ester carboxylesterase
MPTMPCPAGTLCFLDVGQGDPVVLLHAGCSVSAQWNGVIAALRGTHRLLAPDFHGIGGTSPWTGGPEGLIAGEVALIEQMLDHAGGKAHVVGHSYGGWMALHAIGSLASKIASLTLIEPAAVNMLRDVDEEAHDEAHRLYRAILDDVEQARPEQAAERFIDYWGGAGSWRRMRAAFRDTTVALVPHLYVMHLAGMADPIRFSDLRDIDLPTLLLCGEASPLAPRRTIHHLAGTFRYVTSTVIAGAAHMSPMTHAALVSGLLSEHFAAHPAATHER